MKNLLSVLVIGLLTVSQARADQFICSADDKNSELKITTQAAHEDRAGSKNMATVIFTMDDQSKLFIGNEDEELGYKLLSADGELAFLKIKTVTTVGGGCKRCEPSYQKKTYAKLTINNEELDYKCQPVLSL